MKNEKRKQSVRTDSICIGRMEKKYIEYRKQVMELNIKEDQLNKGEKGKEYKGRQIKKKKVTRERNIKEKD